MGPGDLALWGVVLLAVALATSSLMSAAERTWRGGPPTPVGRLAAGLLLAVVALLVLALLWTMPAVARADATVLRHLDGSRDATLTAILTVVTTMGDAVPSLTIAAVLALVVHRQGAHRVVCWGLPLLVLVQLAVQFAMPRLVPTATIADLAPELVVGGSGYLPSGSVARLTSLFLVAALLLHARSPRAARSTVTLGAVLVVVEAMSRLYLGRHLLVDIAAGLVLGAVLFLLVRLALAGPVAAVERQRRHQHHDEQDVGVE